MVITDTSGIHSCSENIMEYQEEKKKFIGECTDCHQYVVYRVFEVSLKTAKCEECKKKRSLEYTREYSKKHRKEINRKCREMRKLHKLPHTSKEVSNRLNDFRKNFTDERGDKMVNKGYNQILAESEARQENK